MEHSGDSGRRTRDPLAVLCGPLSCDGFCNYEESDQYDDQRNYVQLQTVVSSESYQQCKYAQGETELAHPDANAASCEIQPDEYEADTDRDDRARVNVVGFAVDPCAADENEEQSLCKGCQRSTACGQPSPSNRLCLP